MSTMLRTFGLLLLSWPLLADAAAPCRPLRMLPESAVITLDPTQADLSPTIEAVLEADLSLQQDVAGLGGPPGKGPASWTTQEPITIKAQTLQHAVLRSDSTELRLDPDAARSAVATYKGQRYLIYSLAGKAMNADGKALRVRPLLASERSFTLKTGSHLNVDASGHVSVGKGSGLRWQMGDNPDFEFRLAEATPLETTRSTGPSDIDVTIIKPTRMLPGSVMKLQLRGTGFDFRSKPLVFCFAAMPEGASGLYTLSAPGRLVSESSDGALFEVRVPAGMSQATFKAMPGTTATVGAGTVGWLGRFASVRVMGMEGDNVVFDASQAFVTSNFWLSFFAGFILIAAITVVGMLLFEEKDPRQLFARFCRHPTQRFSLANLQILLWTLLVLYAYCFVWLANGILLDISSGVLVLLGISGGTSVLARGIESANGAANKLPIDTSNYSDFITDEHGKLDMLRFQMLGFTLFTVTYSFISVIRSEGLPEIPDNLYLLMGISSATYIGGKFSDTLKSMPDASQAPAPGYEEQMPTEDIRKLQRGVAAPETGKFDDATRKAVIAAKIADGIVPADGSVNALFVERLKADGRFA